MGRQKTLDNQNNPAEEKWNLRTDITDLMIKFQRSRYYGIGEKSRQRKKKPQNYKM